MNLIFEIVDKLLIIQELEILLKCLWKLMSRLEKEFDLTAAERNEILVLLARFLRR